MEECKHKEGWHSNANRQRRCNQCNTNWLLVTINNETKNTLQNKHNVNNENGKQ